MYLLLQNEMRSDSCLLRHLDLHNQQTNRACARHLEFGRVRFLRTSPNLQLAVHHEMRANHWHWSVHRLLDMSGPV